LSPAAVFFDFAADDFRRLAAMARLPAFLDFKF
jgi:hypothetical protein